MIARLLLVISLLNVCLARPSPTQLHVDTLPPANPNSRICVAKIKGRPNTCLYFDTAKTLEWSRVPLTSFNEINMVELSTVPRSGSTWFYSVLNHAVGNISSSLQLSCGHYPFFNFTYPHESKHTFVIIRNPFDAYRSYSKQFKETYPLEWRQFLTKWHEHNSMYTTLMKLSDTSITVISYEHLAADPQGALGPFWYDFLETSLYEWAHVEWIHPRTDHIKLPVYDDYSKQIETFGYSVEETK